MSSLLMNLPAMSLTQFEDFMYSGDTPIMYEEIVSLPRDSVSLKDTVPYTPSIRSLNCSVKLMSLSENLILVFSFIPL